MEGKVKSIYILNLSGSLSSEIQEYFSQKNMTVVDPLMSNDSYEWTHILTKDVHDFSLINKTYKTVENDIRIISLSKVLNPQNFLISNGKLVLDEVWFQTGFGRFILDKLFLESADLELDKNYPHFTEVGAFNVTNPFSTGDSLDRLVQNAFDGDFPALAIRTYFDHLLMYLTGLKAKGKTGLPFEVSYGSFENVFAFQIHLYAKGLNLEDILGSFSSTISKKAEEYLLYVAIQSVDFFDLTYLPEVEKIIITSLWNKDERILAENKGFLLTSISASDNIETTQFYGVTSSLVTPVEVKDFSEKIEIPGVVDNEDEDFNVSGKDVSENLTQKLSSEIDLDKMKTILSGNIDLGDESKIISGSPEDLREMISHIKGLADAPETVVRIGGSKLDVDNFVQKISGGITNKKSDTWKVKSFGGGLNDSIKSKLSEFSIKLGKNAEDLTNEELSNFNKYVLPEFLNSQVDVNSDTVKNMMGSLKNDLDKTLKDGFMVDSAESLFDAIKTPEDEERAKNILIDSLKKLLNQNFNLNTKGSLSDVDKSVLVKSLSKLLQIDEDKIQDIISSSKSSMKTMPILSTQVSEKEKELTHQIKLLNTENNSLRDKIKTLGKEVQLIKDSRKTILELQEKGKSEILNSERSLGEEADQSELVKQLQERLGSIQGLKKEGSDEVSIILEKVKTQEKELRQVQLELKQKDVLLFQEVEKVNKKLLTKDLMLDKAKQSLVQLSEKKDMVINDLKLRLDSLGAVANQSTALTSQIKELEKQNQNNIKMIEMYKNKISTLATGKTSGKLDQDSLKQDLKRFELINSQLKNQLEAMKKELTRYQDKVAIDNNQMTKLKMDNQKLELEIKKLNLSTRKDQTVNTNSNQEIENELKKALNKSQTFELQLKEATHKLRETEKKLSEALKNPVKNNNSEDAVKKAVQLETNMKKLSQDLIESKNQYNELKKELNKVKQEKVALQNQMDKLKKDQSKAGTGAAAKKNKAA